MPPTLPIAIVSMLIETKSVTTARSTGHFNCYLLHLSPAVILSDQQPIRQPRTLCVHSRVRFNWLLSPLLRPRVNTNCANIQTNGTADASVTWVQPQVAIALTAPLQVLVLRLVGAKVLVGLRWGWLLLLLLLCAGPGQGPEEVVIGRSGDAAALGVGYVSRSGRPYKLVPVGLG